MAKKGRKEKDRSIRKKIKKNINRSSKNSELSLSQESNSSGKTYKNSNKTEAENKILYPKKQKINKKIRRKNKCKKKGFILDNLNDSNKKIKRIIRKNSKEKLINKTAETINIIKENKNITLYKDENDLKDLNKIKRKNIENNEDKINFNDINSDSSENGDSLNDLIKEFENIDINVSFEDENKNIENDKSINKDIIDYKDIFKEKEENVEIINNKGNKIVSNFKNSNISKLTNSNKGEEGNNYDNKDSPDFNTEKANNINLNENVDLYIDKLTDNEIQCRLKKFTLQRYQGKKKNQTKLIYKCINLRKDEHLRQKHLKRFCDATIIYDIMHNNYTMTVDHSIECYNLYNPYKNIIKQFSENEITKKQKIDYNDLLTKYLNSNLTLSLHNFKKYAIELYTKNNYIFEYDTQHIINIYNKFKKSDIYTEKIIFKFNLTLKNKPFLKSFSFDFQLKNSNNKIINSKFILWGAEDMIYRAKKSKHFFIDSTFKKPKDYYQFFIVMFIDILTDKAYPVFYATLSDKTESLYCEVLRKIYNLLDYENNKYKNKITITIDFEGALYNAIKKIFGEVRLIGCLFHYKQNLIKNATILGLMKKDFKEKTLFIINNILAKLPFTFHIKGIEEIYNALCNINSISHIYKEYTDYFEKQ